jgi:hypothetical protein
MIEAPSELRSARSDATFDDWREVEGGELGPTRRTLPARVPSYTVRLRYIEIVQRRLEIRLLGPVEASAGGAPVALGGVRQRSLLARLALALIHN